MNSVPAPPPHIRLILSSEFSNLDRVVNEAQAFMLEHVSDEDLVYRVVLVTSEAVTNAIKHGNKFDLSKSVVLDIAVDRSRIHVSVEDEGEGFDRSKVANPLDEENLLRDNGRGLFLIDTMADTYQYELDGRRLRMTFNRS